MIIIIIIIITIIIINGKKFKESWSSMKRSNHTFLKRYKFSRARLTFFCAEELTKESLNYCITDFPLEWQYAQTPSFAGNANSYSRPRLSLPNTFRFSLRRHHKNKQTDPTKRFTYILYVPQAEIGQMLYVQLRNESFLVVIHTSLAHTHTTLFHGDEGTRLYS